MKTFFDFLRRYNYFFVFVLLELIGFFILFRFNSYQGSVWYTSANKHVAKINRLYDDTKSYFYLSTANQRLNKDNVRLLAENELLREQLLFLQKDTTAVERLLHDSLRNTDLLDALVVSSSLRHTNNYFIIDKGSVEGIRPEMGVVGEGAVAGIVYLTGSHYSLVIPIINSKSSISCRIRNANYFGYLEWDGTDPLYATLTEIPRYAKVKPGDIVETSGYSGIFPPGIFVGKVSSVRPSPNRENYLLEVHLGADYATLRNVCVLQTPYKTAYDSLFHRAAEAE